MEHRVVTAGLRIPCRDWKVLMWLGQNLCDHHTTPFYNYWPFHA